jgi:hypothetical protein
MIRFIWSIKETDRVGNPTPGAKEKKDRLAAVFAEKPNREQFYPVELILK